MAASVSFLSVSLPSILPFFLFFFADHATPIP